MNDFFFNLNLSSSLHPRTTIRQHLLPKPHVLVQLVLVFFFPEQGSMFTVSYPDRPPMILKYSGR